MLQRPNFIAVLALTWVVTVRTEPARAEPAPLPPPTPPAASSSPAPATRVAPSPAGAPLPADPTLARLIAESLAVRPELERSAAVVRARKERAPQAGALPDPMLQVGIQNDSFSNIEIGNMETSYLWLMASQTFPWPGKRDLRRGVAELEGVEAEQVLARVRLSTEAEVRRAYLDLLLVRDRLALLAQLEALWSKSFGVARARYEAGDGAQSDVLRAQLEQNRIRQRRVTLEAEEKSRLLALNRLRARPLDAPIETSVTIRELPALADQESRFSSERALLESPEVGAARLAVRRAERSVGVAEREYYPDLTVGAGVMWRAELPPMWQVSLGGPLPVYASSKQSRAVAENQAWAAAARHDVTALEQLVALRTAERRAVFASLRQTIDLYEQGLLVQSRATTESTLAQYEVGRVSFASVLEATAGLIADQDGFLESIAAAHRVLIAEAERSLDAPPLPSVGAPSMPSAGGSSGMSGVSGSTQPAMPPSSAPSPGGEAARGGAM